jgi:preprotein translocase subunit SecD
MFKDLRIRILITALIVGVCLFFLIPSLVPEIPPELKSYLPKDKIRLGLDLQGGMNLVLEVETEKAVESVIDRSINDIKEALINGKVRFRDLEKTGSTISLELANKESSDTFTKLLHDSYPDFEVKSSEVVQEREKVVLKLKDKKAEQIRKSAVEQSLETIRNRIDQFGVSEPEIIPQGDDRIMIQLPGIKDPKRAINLIGRTALLEFKLVDDENSVEEAVKGNIPPGDVVLYG